MSEPDELFSLRSLFYSGAFQQAVNEASGLNRLAPHLAKERDEFLYRAHVALGQYDTVIRSIGDDASVPPSLRAIKLLATFMRDKDTREIALLQIQEWMQDPASANDTTLQTVAATMRMHNDEALEAIKVLHHGTTLEHCAMLVQLYLRIDRIDLAQKQLRQMTQADEDAVLSQLATAWVNMALGGAKFQEAALILEEFVDKYGGSPTVFNSLAVVHLQTGEYEDAERNLQDALSKDPKNADALANMICVAHHLSRGNDVISRYMNQLQAVDAAHPLLTSLATLENAFERVSATMGH